MELSELKDKIQALIEEALKDSESVETNDSFIQWKARYLGRKGELRGLFASMGKLDASDKADAGKILNDARQELETKASEVEAQVKSASAKSRPKEQIDITLPGRVPLRGRKHPLRQINEEIIEVFTGMGFDVALGPEIETEYYHFDALNTPAHHPARDLQDTFYLEDGTLLRAQTSPVQIRYMEEHRPPIKIVAPGRVYRCDSDVTHSPMFSQIEGLLVDRRITLGDLKGALESFLHQIFTKDTPLRFRPHFFPFTEPSAEMDIGCLFCEGSGCRVCSYSGWLEVLGAGLVHPNVLKMVNIDPEEYSGFAFGIGIERIAMLKFRINDIRLFFENDMRFLAQF